MLLSESLWSQKVNFTFCQLNHRQSQLVSLRRECLVLQTSYHAAGETGVQVRCLPGEASLGLRPSDSLLVLLLSALQVVAAKFPFILPPLPSNLLFNK